MGRQMTWIIYKPFLMGEEEGQTLGIHDTIMINTIINDDIMINNTPSWSRSPTSSSVSMRRTTGRTKVGHRSSSSSASLVSSSAPRPQKTNDSRDTGPPVARGRQHQQHHRSSTISSSSNNCSSNSSGSRGNGGSRRW